MTVGQCVGDRRDKEMSVGATQLPAQQHKYNYIIAQIQTYCCTNTMLEILEKSHFTIAQIH